MADQLPRGGEYLITDVQSGDVFMPEDFNDDQRDIARMTQEFVQGEVLPHIDELAADDFKLTVGLMKKCGELGLLAMDAPDAYGGMDFDKATVMMVMERLGPGASFSVSYAAHTGLGTLPFIYYGTEAQKEKYLQRIITGELLSAYALTEPGAGTDALNIRTEAVKTEDGKHFKVNGTKQFITNAGFADIFIVFVKVDREHFTALILERDTPGLHIGAEEKKMGIRGSSTCELVLEDALVPVENVLGEIGRGHKIAFNILNVGRFKLGAAVTGAAKSSLVDAIKYANQRKQFDTPIARFGAIKEKFAAMTAEIFASESLIYRLAGLLDHRIATVPRDSDDYYVLHNKAIEEYAIECSIAKVFCSDMLSLVVDHVVQVFGGYGFVEDYPAERFYRDERINRIFEGTNEINRMLVPGMLLKRAMKGEIPLTREAMKAVESLMTPSFDEPDLSDPLAREKALLSGLKTLFLVLSGSAVRKFMDNIKDEQEILLALADLAIQVFALESVVLRAGRILNDGDKERGRLARAAARCFAFSAAERCGTAGRRAANYIEAGDTLTMLLSGVRRFTRYDGEGMLEDVRALADAVGEAEKYPF